MVQIVSLTPHNSSIDLKGVLSEGYPYSKSARLYDYLISLAGKDFSAKDLAEGLSISGFRAELYIDNLLRLKRIVPTHVNQGKQHYVLNTRNRVVREIISKYNSLRGISCV